MATNYRELVVWQRAMDLVEVVYQLSEPWPAREQFGLTAQVRRAGVSVPCNIAEGDGRGSDAEFVRFLSIAHGSLREVETQVLLAVRLNYCQKQNAEGVLNLCGEVGRLINGLIRKLRATGAS